MKAALLPLRLNELLGCCGIIHLGLNSNKKLIKAPITYRIPAFNRAQRLIIENVTAKESLSTESNSENAIILHGSVNKMLGIPANSELAGAK
jgi:hypothetical protein